MEEKEFYLAGLRELQGPDAPAETAEKIAAALADESLATYALKEVFEKAAWEIAAAYPRDQVNWGPTVDAEKCVGCKKCYGFCKQGVYRMEDGKVNVVKREGCVIYCSHCMPMCPTGAITFPEYESRLDLIRELRSR